MLLLIGSYLLLVFALPLTLGACLTFRSLPVGSTCTRCRGDTIPLRSTLFRALSRLPHVRLQRRWCLCCGWEGAVRAAPHDAAAPRRPDTAAPAAVAEAPARPAMQTLDVRSVQIDGRAFRVMLQCWNRTGWYYGRLMYVAPTGRLWLDADHSFSGMTEGEVIGQALSLPDRQLQQRLRSLVTD